MSPKELNRVDVIRDLNERRIRQTEAASLLQLSRRQTQRLINQFREHGQAGLVSQRRGKPSNRRFLPEFKQRVMGIIHESYADFGPTFANEKLKEKHQITLSTETLRQWMLAEGLWVSKRQTKPKVYQPRYRRECLGELVQIDGSHHDWFEGRADKCCLIVYIDDATGRLMSLRFSDVESTFDYMAITRQYIEEHGKPVAFYSDKHSVFKINKEEIKTGNQMTEFGRALYELNIELICANSPQAKGRVERANKTLQDRLIKEMRLAGINSIEEANTWLPSFVSDFNQRFARTPYSLQNAHRPVRETPKELDDIFARQRSRTVTKSLTLQYDKVIYLLDKTDTSERLISKVVMVYDYPDGSISIKRNGVAFSYSVFDKLRRVTQSAVTDNKRLSAALSFAMKNQKERENNTLCNRSKTISRAAQKKAVNITLNSNPNNM